MDQQKLLDPFRFFFLWLYVKKINNSLVLPCSGLAKVSVLKLVSGR